MIRSRTKFARVYPGAEEAAGVESCAAHALVHENWPSSLGMSSPKKNTRGQNHKIAQQDLDEPRRRLHETRRLRLSRKLRELTHIVES